MSRPSHFAMASFSIGISVAQSLVTGMKLYLNLASHYKVCSWTSPPWLVSRLWFSSQVSSLPFLLLLLYSYNSRDLDDILIVFLSADRHNLQDPVKVEQTQMRIIGSLRDHVTYNGDAQRKPHYFSRILSKLPELRSLSVQGLQRIFYLKLEDLIPAPPVIEAMFTSTLPF